MAFAASAEDVPEDMLISKNITASACDDKKVEDDVKTAENRAIDKACLAAVKLSAVIQNKYPDLNSEALDVISYRIIDDYLTDTTHEITYNNKTRVCVKITSRLKINAEELENLVTEYKSSTPPAEQIAKVAEKVIEDTTLKPETPDEKKLLFIDDMYFWDGNKTPHYAKHLADLFSKSEYFYVTDNKDVADFIVKPNLLRAEVDEIDEEHRKMQITVALEVSAPYLSDFSEISVQQNHFILFAAEKDEQEIADNLIKKLLVKAAEDVSARVDKYSAKALENEQIRGLVSN